MARLAAVTALALLFVAASVAGAQGYPQLHVVALSQRADRSTVEPGGTFAVTIHVRVAQRRERLDELILGSFENCEIISNETVRTATADGTDFVERLTVQALAPGEATISPAYIDAADPALGKPMRFSSNAIRVQVAGAAVPDAGIWQGFAANARRLVVATAIVAGIFAAAFVLIVLFVRRRRPAKSAAPARVAAVPAAPAAAPPPIAAAATNEQLARSAEAYRGGRSDAALAHVRTILFGLAGAPGGATLIDALHALGERDAAPLRAALLAAERAAFGPAGERIAAGDEMLAAIQAYAGGRAANEGAWTR